MKYFLDRVQSVIPLKKPVFIVILGLFFSLGFAYLPEYPGLNPAARTTLFILVLASFLWVSSAMPAFAVAILVIGLEIALLGRPGGIFATGPRDWEVFVQSWGSPVIWLFIGGLIMAKSAQKTGLDLRLTNFFMPMFGSNPKMVLLGIMSITFTFSMFMSNTATTAMMIGLSVPLVSQLKKEGGFKKAVMLGIAVSANVGGMATIIGTPPNAIAAGLLDSVAPVSFFNWMLMGLPLALVLMLVTWVWLGYRYPCGVQIKFGDFQDEKVKSNLVSQWITFLVFIVTILLWMSGPIHGIPTTVVAFIPITILIITGIMDYRDIRSLHWDVLLLLAGGLSLGTAVSKTGLAEWIVGWIPSGTLDPWMLVVALCLLVSLLSNFMSNTAAANVIIPLALGMAAGSEQIALVAVALSASAAMCLPVSTPPNAIAFSSGHLESRDFLKIGLVLGVVIPLVSYFWIKLVANLIF